MAGRVPLGSGANQNRVFIDLTDETDPGDSEVVSAYAPVHLDLPKTALPKPPRARAPLCLSLSRQFFLSPQPTVYLTI